MAKVFLLLISCVYFIISSRKGKSFALYKVMVARCANDRRFFSPYTFVIVTPTLLSLRSLNFCHCEYPTWWQAKYNDDTYIFFSTFTHYFFVISTAGRNPESCHHKLLETLDPSCVGMTRADVIITEGSNLGSGKLKSAMFNFHPRRSMAPWIAPVGRNDKSVAVVRCKK